MMKLYLAIALVLFSPPRAADLTLVEKEFEATVGSLTLYQESVGADAVSSEHYYYWGKGGRLWKYRFMVAEYSSGVRLLEDLYFTGNGELILYTFWSGKRKDLPRLEKGLGPHFLAREKCLFQGGKMTRWYMDGKLRNNVSRNEWVGREQEARRLRKEALLAWKDLLGRKNSYR